MTYAPPPAPADDADPAAEARVLDVLDWLELPETDPEPVQRWAQQAAALSPPNCEPTRRGSRGRLVR